MTTPDKQRQAQPPPIILQLSAADGRDSHERVMRTAKAARDLAEASPVEALAHAAVAVDEALASLAPRLADDSDAPKGTPTLSPWWILQLERSYYLTKDQSKLLWSFDELCRDPDLADARDTDAVGLRGRALEFAEQVVSPDFETQDELAEWFLARFETPEEAGLSPSSSGAGWDWAGLGPHNAGAELRARFSQVSEAQESHIVDAVGLLEGSTTQWASKSDLSVEADGPGDSTAFDSGPHLDTVVELSSAARPAARPAAFRHAGLVQRDGLAQLAGLHESQTLLPWLVRQLILATTPGLRELRLPDAEGIRKPGFDGIVETASGNAWVPGGRSVWELSTTGSPQSKSQSDFTKRTETTDDDERHATTFVTVQLAEWPNVQRWCSQRRAEAKWRDVRAYDLDDLVAWLEVAPSVWFQLSERLGIKTPAVISARAWWQRRLNSTKPPLHADVLLAGRRPEAERLNQRIRSGMGTTTVVAPSTDEAIEFALAALIDGPQAGEQLLGDLDPLFDRCLLVSDEAEWRRLAAQVGPLVLIPTSLDIAGVETDHHHHVLLPVARHHDTGRLNPSVLANDDCVNVPPVAPMAIADALSASGIESARAYRLGEIARRNFTALRRTLAVDPLLKRPPWASEEPGSIRHAAVRSAILAGSWREYGDDAAPSEDREILARLVGPAGRYTYETLAEAFAELSAGHDPLLERTARGWRLIHPVDAWQAVGDPPLTPGVTDRIVDVVVDVLGEPDPAFELSAQHRVMAPAFGWGRRYSSDLRHGLTSTLGILGTGAHRIGELQQTPAHQWVSWAGSLVHRLLGLSQEERATANSGLLTRRWADSADHLPLLAEASPNQFLQVLRDALDDPNEPLRPMFADRPGGDMPPFVPSSPHTGLLWALETLAWMPEYFGEAVNALVRLAKLDPGGRLANRPLSSLASIFCVWKPQSGVDRDRRLQALRSLVDRYPEIAWRLLPELVPEHFQTLIPSRQPLYGPSTVVTAQPTYEEVAKDVDTIAEMLLISATTPKLLWELTKIVDRLPSQRRSDIWSRWAKFALQESSWIEEAREHWSDLDKLARRHRTHEDRDWALPNQDVAQIEALATSLRPDDVLDNNLWLFTSWHPNLADIKLLDDFEAYEAVLAERRTEAIAAIELVGGLSALIQLTLAARDANGDALSIGLALARLAFPDAATAIAPQEPLEVDELQLVRWLAEAHAPGDAVGMARRDLSYGFFLGCQKRLGGTALFDRAQNAELEPSEQAALLVLWPKQPDAWEAAASLGQETDDEYWRRFVTWDLGDFGHAQVAAERLLEVDRPDAVVERLGHYFGDEDMLKPGAVTLALCALDALPTTWEQSGSSGMFPHFVEKLHEWIWRATGSPAAVTPADGESDRSAEPPFPALTQLAEVEARLLATSGDCIEPRFLHRLMAEDPAVFTLVMSVAFKPDESQAPSASGASEQDVDLVDAAKPSPDDTSGQPLSEILQASPGLGFRVAHSWRTVPGSDAEGSIDSDFLVAWIDEARERLVENNRLDIGDQYIGHALAGAVAGNDGVPIPPAVRDALEHCRSSHVDLGLQVALSNDASANGGSVSEAAAIDCTEAAGRLRDQAARIADRWPRTAHVLRSLAEGQEAQARWYRDLLDDRA